MADDSSERLHQGVHRLFHLGAIGMLSDAELLERFASRDDETANAAFEELLVRHGRMVLLVCRRVLSDLHDSEDAFQATFLVLANRARSIHRGESVASWLFGVAHRVALRVKREALRRQRLHQRLAVETVRDNVSAEAEPDWEVLHQEINDLPERFRAPVVLCYFEGQTTSAAALSLGVPEATVRGRLARARERLRRRLIGRGLATVAAGSQLAGAPARAQVVVPTALLHSTIRIALGFARGDAAAALAHGVLKTMLLNQLKVASALAILVMGTLAMAWWSSAAAIDDRGVVQVVAAQDAGKPSARTPAVPTTRHRIIGIVKVEGTGQPLAKARFHVLVGNDIAGDRKNERIVETGADGRFTIDVPAGQARIWFSDPPPGYLVPNTTEIIGNLTIGPDQAAIEREYRVRPGTVWDFRFIDGADRGPSDGFVVFRGFAEMSRALADDRGHARLTLPIEAGKRQLQVSKAPAGGGALATGFLIIDLEWDAGFQPGKLERVAPVEGNGRRFRLVDSAGRTAVVQAPEPIEPRNEDGRLWIQVAFPAAGPNHLATLSGRVVDVQGQPIAGAQVTLNNPGAPGPIASEFTTTTDNQGRYRLVGLPRRGVDGGPIRARLLVTREGYAGFGSPLLQLDADGSDQPQGVDIIRLQRGVSISGVVVDHRDRPAAGVWVRSQQLGLDPGATPVPQSRQTDEQGRFRFADLREGVVHLMIIHGNTPFRRSYFVDGSPGEVHLRLPEPEREAAPVDFAALRQPPPPPIAVGRPAVEWQVGEWSDGRDHALPSTRGKVVVLYFWGIGFPQSLTALPALGKLAARYQPRGVEFLAIHNAEPDERHAQEQGKKVLAANGAPLVLAVDRMRVASHARGMTADQYGVTSPPAVVVIDRAGAIAYRSDANAGGVAVNAVFPRPGPDTKVMTAEQANERAERVLSEEIEKVLTRLPKPLE